MNQISDVATPAPRAFSGVDRLYGEGSHARLTKACVMVVGVGGVGSWAVEAIARHGVGEILLVDMDNVAESNINRQLQALEPTLGMAKVDALGARIAQINPRCQVIRIEDCKVLQIAPSAYRRHAARCRDASLLSARAKRDAALQPAIKQVWDANRFHRHLHEASF